MTYTSPWQSAFFVRGIALVRRILRPWPRLEDRFIAAVTADQNRRVVRYLEQSPPRKLLLILPRCVKKPGCPADVKNSLTRCADCHECPLGDVARLCLKYDIEALVAFRSHIAFEMARTVQPDVIIATACHDRLVKALRSVPEIPAILAPLPDMEKMCVGAEVDLVWLEEQLRLVTRSRAHSGSGPQPASEPVSRAVSAENS